MEASQPAGAGPLSHLSPENAQTYNNLRQDYAQNFKLVIELEEEKREHVLVLEAIKDLEEKRRCRRLVGGVLVERTVGEVLPSLKSNIELLEKAMNTYNENLKKKEKDLLEFELKYGIKNEKTASKEEDKGEGAKKVTGVLA